MKIIAVGMNYVAHCHELHADEKLPEEPVIFMKPDSALLKDSKPFFIPDFSQQVDYETELSSRLTVSRIMRMRLHLPGSAPVFRPRNSVPQKWKTHFRNPAPAYMQMNQSSQLRQMPPLQSVRSCLPAPAPSKFPDS